MSLLQNEDFTIWYLRTSYLSEIKDGIGDRLINVNSSVLNAPCFRATGWSTHQGGNAASLNRSYSPPIPTATAVASEYFHIGGGRHGGGPTFGGAGAQDQDTAAVNAAQGGGAGAARALGILDDGDEEEGGMITGGIETDTTPIGLREHRRAIGKKSRRKTKQGDEGDPRSVSAASRRAEDDDSSDLSDDSDEEPDGIQRAVHQIKFQKMPIRRRADSSPIRDSMSRNDGQSLALPSPPRKASSPDNRNRSGSLSAVEVVKSRARADTVTSSDMSSENEVESSIHKRRIHFASHRQVSTVDEVGEDQSYETSILEDGEGDMNEVMHAPDDMDSVGSPLSSLGVTAGSGDLLNNVGLTDGMQSTPPGMIGQMLGKQTSTSPLKKSRMHESKLDNLPLSRPISTLQPVSLLSQALQAQKKAPSNPVEKYANYYGKGTTETPLYIKIYYAASDDSTKSYEMPILKEINPSDPIFVTVADTIGVALWRYVEDHIQPELERDLLNVNKWCLRMVEDEEVDYDFPALGANRPIVDFTSNNNRAAAGRGRSRSKPFDEFALVKASEAEFAKNQEVNPQADDVEEDANESNFLTVPSPNVLQVTQKPAVHRNPILGQPFPSALDDASLTPADLPAVPTPQATPRLGSKKTLKVHYVDNEATTQVTTMSTSTDSYLAEVLDSVCKKWGLEKGTYVLKVTGSNTIAPLDRTVEALGSICDLDLVRRRFGAAPLTKSAHSPGSSSPNAPLLIDTAAQQPAKRSKKGNVFGTSHSANRMLHPLAYQADMLGGYHRRYHVIRKQSMSFTASNQRILAFDNDYLHIMPADNAATGVAGGAKNLFESSSTKTRSISFNDVVGSKVSRRHPKSFRIVVLRGNDAHEQKRYDFEARNAAEAAEIVEEVKKNMMLYRV
ncbi:hypothetical protein KEM56_005101 [Ascosphaera pollenicola]|nr:hypothetical protein KEM56_005101 [Ascosphaera pollenicola]